ncbi:AMP phosphorylase [Haloarchaeobius amylolyticus]|uniref:AMP phosphorylase n=1 Tax=Haloarchaeobius amylolyticus TaxID=1198296 RepID=UPI0022719C3D|nr:AMP phosphorylase [Haloarchaeobius amylolyticus]
MRLTAKEVDIGTRHPTVLLNTADAEELAVNPLDRVQMQSADRTTIAIVELMDEVVARGELGVTKGIRHVTGEVEVKPAPRPRSVEYIRKKLDDIELERHELVAIVHDIDANRLSDVELGAYVTGVYTNGLSLSETTYLTECMTEAGKVVMWEDDVVADKHSIGGVAGNRVTPIVVAIVAACGLKIPKTSSRAVTSPAGTADTMEVFCEVEFSLEEMKEIVEETNGCFVWGGSVNLSPVDDKIIRAETPLSLDPPGQLIASVLSKKKSAGSTHVVVDLPYGEGAKVQSLVEARELAEDFKRVAEHLGLTVECTITTGEQPIGRGIGPVLEARDVLAVLEGGGPQELRLKALRLADILLECCGIDEDATAVLDSGRALERFRRIVAAQDGDPDVTMADLEPGAETAVVESERDGVVTHVNNRLVSAIARRAGAPRDAGAGLYLHRREDDEVSVGDPLFTIYAEQAAKLEDALELAERTEAIRVRGPEDALVERL